MKINSVLQRVFLAFQPVVVATLLASCTPCVTYTQMCDLIGGAPDAATVSSDRSVVLEDPGTIIAYHGFSCAESDNRGTEDLLKIEESLDIPPYAADATVFLNGWRMNYLSGDHHVAGLGTMISNIRLEDETLNGRRRGFFRTTTSMTAINGVTFTPSSPGTLQISILSLITRMGAAIPGIPPRPTSSLPTTKKPTRPFLPFPAFSITRPSPPARQSPYCPAGSGSSGAPSATPTTTCSSSGTIWTMAKASSKTGKNTGRAFLKN